MLDRMPVKRKLRKVRPMLGRVSGYCGAECQRQHWRRSGGLLHAYRRRSPTGPRVWTGASIALGPTTGSDDRW